MLGVLVVFWYGGRLIVLGEFKPEQFLSFYRALFRLTWPLAALGFLVSVLQRGLAGALGGQLRLHAIELRAHLGGVGTRGIEGGGEGVRGDGSNDGGGGEKLERD